MKTYIIHFQRGDVFTIIAYSSTEALFKLRDSNTETEFWDILKIESL